LAATARHALYLLEVLAVQVLTLEAEINPTVIAAVGALLVGIPVGSFAGGNLWGLIP
jgi:hypothetical protein